MKSMIFLIPLLVALTNGCTLNSVSIEASDNSIVECSNSVDKPVTVDALPMHDNNISGNTVPVGGRP